jgi:hypothetical protein
MSIPTVVDHTGTVGPNAERQWTIEKGVVDDLCESRR